MLFNSIHFLLFFPIVCLLYHSIPPKLVKARNITLLLASYYFYMNWKPEYALLLLASTVITYLAALGISHYSDKRMKKLFLVSSLILNLGILFTFKYYNFAAENITAFFQTCGLAINLPNLDLLLPVGISFYTFQALGYSIDVYRGTILAEKDFPTYALFVSFFPQLVAGPIERSNNLLPQFKEEHHFDYNAIITGIKLMVWGYFMKLAVADRCGMYVDAVFNNVDKHNGGAYILASALFPFQIYGDFAGYSLIAIGAAKIMGFSLMRNFHRPYFSCTIGEFWRRWHISLSTWFKDYVYIPLGGNRIGKWRNYANVLIIFLISGIWHGANWTFFCWGFLHGIFLCIEKALGINKKKYHGAERLFHWFVTFAAVCFAWILFRANNMSDAIMVIKGIFTNFGVPNISFAMFTEISLAIFAIGILCIKEMSEEFSWQPVIHLKKSAVAVHIYVITTTAFVILFGVLEGGQFIYFQF